METQHSINSETDERQKFSIQTKDLNLQICKNRDEMLDELIVDTRKKLVKHAEIKYPKINKADQEDLASSTIFKILKDENTKEKFTKSNTPTAYATKILDNLFIDEYRKKKRLVSLEENYIEICESVSSDTSLEYQELIKCLKKLDITDQIILKMFFKDRYTYKEMIEHEDLKHLKNENNLRIRCHRARLKVAKIMGKEI